jgi:hypothetical protein
MKKIFLLLFSISLILSSCRKDNIKIAEPDIPISMDELTIESDFDWKTTKEIQITILAKQSSIANITNLEGISFQKAFIKANQSYTMKLEVPSYEKSVRLKFLDHDIVLELNSSTLNYDF